MSLALRAFSRARSSCPSRLRSCRACWSTTRFASRETLFNSCFRRLWNSRKRSLGDARDGRELRKELQFNAVCLRRHAKAVSAWAHRKWCLENLLVVDRGATEEIAHSELALCASLSFRHARNYNAWAHRNWVARRCAQRDGFLDQELASASEWLKMKVTDYSCAQHALMCCSASLGIAAKDEDEMGAFAVGDRWLRTLEDDRADLAAKHPHLDVPRSALRTYARALARLKLVHDDAPRASPPSLARPADLGDDAAWLDAARGSRRPAYPAVLKTPGFATNPTDDTCADDVRFTSMSYGDHLFDL